MSPQALGAELVQYDPIWLLTMGAAGRRCRDCKGVIIVHVVILR